MNAHIDPARMKASSGEAAELLSAMANPNRLLILCNLASREMPVQELADEMGMSQSALSQQLAKLRALRLVSTRRDGRTINYRVASSEVERLLVALQDIYCTP